MRTLLCLPAIVAAILFLNKAGAHPDGAPWGSARPSAPENCSSCHFDGEAIRDSSLIHIAGLPQNPEPGETYDLTIAFDGPDAVVAGFQLIAQTANDEAGTFASAAANVEFIGAAIRSTAPKKNGGAVSWSLQWRAPAEFVPPIVFFVAATAANHDGSPLGDTIHFRSYTLAPAPPIRDR